eukprot:9315521-Ditylum_brightwellii.AAC.1
MKPITTDGFNKMLDYEPQYKSDTEATNPAGSTKDPKTKSDSASKDEVDDYITDLNTCKWNDTPSKYDIGEKAEYTVGKDTQIVTGLPFNVNESQLKKQHIPDIARIPITLKYYLKESSKLTKEQCERLAKPTHCMPLQQEYLLWHHQ